MKTKMERLLPRLSHQLPKCTVQAKVITEHGADQTLININLDKAYPDFLFQRESIILELSD